MRNKELRRGELAGQPGADPLLRRQTDLPGSYRPMGRINFIMPGAEIIRLPGRISKTARGSQFGDGSILGISLAGVPSGCAWQNWKKSQMKRIISFISGAVLLMVFAIYTFLKGRIDGGDMLTITAIIWCGGRRHVPLEKAAQITFFDL